MLVNNQTWRTCDEAPIRLERPKPLAHSRQGRATKAQLETRVAYGSVRRSGVPSRRSSSSTASSVTPRT